MLNISLKDCAERTRNKLRMLVIHDIVQNTQVNASYIALNAWIWFGKCSYCSICLCSLKRRVLTYNTQRRQEATLTKACAHWLWTAPVWLTNRQHLRSWNDVVSVKLCFPVIREQISTSIQYRYSLSPVTVLREFQKWFWLNPNILRKYFSDVPRKPQWNETNQLASIAIIY